MKVKFNAPQTVANEQNGLTVKYAAAKRQLPRLRWYLLLLLVSAPLVYFAVRIIVGVLWDSSPGFVTMPQAVLKASQSGQIEVLARDGDTVAAGAVVARIRSVMVTEPVAASGVPPSLQALDQSASLGRINHSNQVLRLASEQQMRMTQRLQVVNQLIREGAATLAERSQAEAQLAAAKSDVLRAQADTLGNEFALARLRLEQQLGRTMVTPQAPAKATEIVAPVAGKIIRSYALNQEWVNAGADLMLMQRQQEPEIRVFVSPSDSRNAQVGEHADLRFLDGTRMPATVVRIEAEAARTPPERVGPLATRSQSIVAVLQPDHPLDSKHRINELPLDVRFSRIGF
jgi:biotin carboxyl carrier protein